MLSALLGAPVKLAYSVTLNEKKVKKLNVDKPVDNRKKALKNKVKYKSLKVCYNYFSGKIERADRRAFSALFFCVKRAFTKKQAR